ncbi:hypothetical protein Tco_1537708, partial [Tanacetum coccineum]
MAKTINGKVQLHALVDGKKIIITESTVRIDLQLEEDAEGIDCLPNSTIFEQLALMGDPSENVIDKVVHKELDDSLVRAATTASSLEVEQDSGGGPRGNTFQSDEDRLKLNELMELCTTLQTRVLDLEKLKRLYKVGLSARVESSRDEEDLGEDASKQRRINVIDEDEYITLVNVQDDADNEMFDVNVLGSEEVFVTGQNEIVVEEVVDAAQVSTTATTVTITTEEIT